MQGRSCSTTAFILIRRIRAHLGLLTVLNRQNAIADAETGEPLDPPRVSPARGPPVDWGALVQSQGAGEFKQPSPDDLPMIDIHHR